MGTRKQCKPRRAHDQWAKLIDILSMYIMHLFNKIPSCRPPQLGAWAGFLFFFLFFSAFFIHPRPTGSERREKELSLGNCREQGTGEQVLDFWIWGKKKGEEKKEKAWRKGRGGSFGWDSSSESQREFIQLIEEPVLLGVTVWLQGDNGEKESGCRWV